MNQTGKHNRTALGFAAAIDKLDIIEYLMKINNADFDITDAISDAAEVVFYAMGPKLAIASMHFPQPKTDHSNLINICETGRSGHWWVPFKEKFCSLVLPM